MKIEFTKMHGCGNDYIFFNCINHDINKPEELSKSISNRHFGIGGDGIVLIYKSNKADAKMRMFNADGSEGKMCGNAIRCIGKYLFDNEIIKKKNVTIETISGVKNLTLHIINNLVSSVTVDMGKAEFLPSKIPVKLNGEKIINRKISINGEDYKITCVSIGNPHCVVFQDNIETLNLMSIGPNFENFPIFPERINTEFVKVIDKNTIKMRVWERGSGETLACGTGACAAAVAAVENRFCNKGEDIYVILKGGELIINYTNERILMTGKAEKVFDGYIEI
ncbi:diaminopimelate epimerase [Clostridium isatidis]|uniref:Diaminopimelate epimerase n=1 Tax=Clostridium isatidis TaxID=182773 RepID=A0A343JBG9_9CLOT|nr:diaminopimelate epimerase [Clostridium isatidis]ASW42877.1 diaminopimelate epimerase [Clostridium isatidis]